MVKNKVIPKELKDTPAGKLLYPKYYETATTVYIPYGVLCVELHYHNKGTFNIFINGELREVHYAPSNIGIYRTFVTTCNDVDYQTVVVRSQDPDLALEVFEV